MSSAHNLIAPASPPTLLPGRSAKGWMLLMLRAFLAGLAMIALMALGYLGLPLTLAGIAAAVGTVGAVSAGITAFVASIQGARTEARERDAGYTTAHGRKYEYWQLDPDTGDVLRAPGEREVSRRPRSQWQ